DTHLIGSHHVEKLSKLIKNGWIKLAETLELYNSRENLSTLKKDDPVEVCSLILTTWTEKEGKRATVKKMRNILLTADLFYCSCEEAHQRQQLPQEIKIIITHIFSKIVMIAQNNGQTEESSEELKSRIERRAGTHATVFDSIARHEAPANIIFEDD
uniref:Death domain-containing protein n=1 Tax=Romanomermis culicivorax TaxID=13658 RepID=A0A915L513_ROMCU